MREELGLTAFEAPSRRSSVAARAFNWGEQRIVEREEYRVVHLDQFEPLMTDVVEAESLECFRWWRLADLETTEERLTPLSLAAILRRYLSDGAPAELPEEEVLVD